MGATGGICAELWKTSLPRGIRIGGAKERVAQRLSSESKASKTLADERAMRCQRHPIETRARVWGGREGRERSLRGWQGGGGGGVGGKKTSWGEGADG